MESFKDKLLGALGGFGFILYYLITITLTLMPLFVLGFNFFIDLIIIFVITALPMLGFIVELILWVWSFVAILQNPFSAAIGNVIYYIALAVYLFTKILPLIGSFVASSTKKD